MIQSTVSNILLIAVSLAGIGFIIAFHELGHFLFAKMFGMRVQSFSIGFGPRLIHKKIGGTDFALSAIPLGGYVDLGSPEGKEHDSLSFSARPYYQKLLVMVGGISFNVILAYIIFILLFLTGMPATRMLHPTNAIPTIKAFGPNSSAQKAGLRVGDTIVALDGQTINNDTAKLLDLTKPMAEKQAKITVEREGKHEEVTIIIGSRTCLGETVGFLGAEFTYIPLPGKSLLTSIKEGLALANTILLDTLYAFKYLFTSCDTTGLQGPVMIFSASMHTASQGFKIFLIFLAIISINLAILNLIPLPILDGGQILFYTIEAIIGRSIPDRIREYIFIGTWIGFMLLTIYLIGQDIMRIAGHYIEPVLKFLGISK
ncbi:MAG: M50 family metallopeptidase [Candidatus Dependentiae bacterium]|nr:M50 family metallopeptidase [Candidatus Dependentiae bacterium]